MTSHARGFMVQSRESAAVRRAAVAEIGRREGYEVRLLAALMRDAWPKVVR